MKRAQLAALFAGAALGLAGVTAAVVLSRQEGRDAARKFLDRAAPVAEQARKAGERVATTAVEQYHTIAPKAVEALNTVRVQAPQLAETVVAKLPKVAANGKHEPVTVDA
ncbi:MAG: hypothetical protein ACXVDA_07445 [Ktedonobacterales bacterium]